MRSKIKELNCFLSSKKAKRKKGTNISLIQIHKFYKLMNLLFKHLVLKSILFNIYQINPNNTNEQWKIKLG